MPFDFKQKAAGINPKQGEIALAWLGQAGFWLKNSFGETLAIDPYLSDYAERLDGNKRLTRKVVDPEDLIAELVLVSHEHADHLDMDSLPAIIKNGAELFCCKKSAEICGAAGFDMQRVHAMKIGGSKTFKHFNIEAVFADHGDMAPDAVAYVVETEGIKIYFSADTSYQPARMQYIADKKIDILTVAINGEYGNMNERDAAMLADQVKAGVTIPCHFWTLGRHRGNPLDFGLAMSSFAPGLPAYAMCHGEFILYSATGGVVKT